MHDFMKALEALAGAPVLKLLILDAALKALVILAAGSAVAWALRRSAAATRHTVWTASLAAVLALPALAAVVPGVPLPRAIPLALDRPAATASPAEAPAPAETSAPARGLLAVPVPGGGVIFRQEAPSPAVSGSGHAPAGREPETAIDLSGAGSFPWFNLALALWGLGALLLAARLAAGYLRVWSGARGATALAGNDLAREARRLAAELGVGRRVRIVVGPADAMPMTWGVFRPTVLLPAGAEVWSARRRRHVLLHELAHVRRRDHLCQLLAQATCVIHWFNPLAWAAARRLRVERELASDDMVLAAGVRPSEYAEELLEVARTFRRVAGAAMAMAPRSQLGGRLSALLDETRSHRASARGSRRMAWAAAVLAVAGLASLRPWAEAPAEASAPGAGGPGAIAEARPAILTTPLAVSPLAKIREWIHRDDVDGTSASIHIHDDQTTANWSDGGRQARLQITGTVTFTDDETDIATLGSGARLLIEERRGGTTRRLEVKPGGDSGRTYTWTVDGKERPYDAEARAWLARMIPDIYRVSGINAETRVERILDRDGAAGVLGEISAIPSDYVKRIYFVALLGHATLTPEESAAALTQAGKEIHSDYELAQVVVLLAGKSDLDEAGQVAAAGAIAKIASDFEARRALSALVERGDLRPSAREGVLRQAAGIGSDYEAAEFLKLFAGTYPLEGGLMTLYLDAAEGIGSDYELHRALDAALSSGELAPADLERLIRLAGREIGSDYELASLLTGIARARHLDGNVRQAYLDAAGKIGSEYESQRALAALARN